MGTMIETDIPQSKTEVFMSPDQIPTCVNANDEADASSNCFDACDSINIPYQKEADNSDSKNWAPLPCADLNDFTPLETFSPFECYGGGPINPPSTPFTAVGTLVMGDITATTDQLSGMMDFKVDACAESAATCSVSLTTLQAAPRTMRGSVHRASGRAASFAVADLQVELLQSAVGELDQRTGAITFRESIFATVSAGPTTLDGLPLSTGLHQALFVVRGARGHWDGKHLNLDLRWSLGDTVLSLSLTGG